MTELRVDGDIVTLPEAGQETVADVLGLVASTLDTKKRIIRVHIDGVEVTGNRNEHLRMLPSLTTIEMETGLASDLASDSLDSIEEFLVALLAELTRAAVLFRSDTFEKANEVFARCMDGMRILLNTTISVAGLLQVGAAEVGTGQGNLEENTKRVGRVLDEMIEAQTNRDSILIADLIEYELNPLLEDWNGAIESLRGIRIEG